MSEELKKENREPFECPTCGCKGDYMNGVRDGKDEARHDFAEKIKVLFDKAWNELHNTLTCNCSTMEVCNDTHSCDLDKIRNKLTPINDLLLKELKKEKECKP